MYSNKITTRQFIGFIIVARVSLSFSVMQVLNILPQNQDQWIMILVSSIYIIIASSPLLFLSNKFKDYTITGFMKKIYHKSIANIICVLYGLYFMIGVINALTIVTELITTSILADANLTLVIAVMLLTCMYIVSRGVNVIIRATDLLGMPVLLTLFALILLGLNNVDFSLFSPILRDSTLLEINMGAIQTVYLYSDILLISMIAPELENKNDINKILIISVFVNVVILIIGIVVTQGTLGIEYARHSVFPFLIYTRLIDISEILERIDAIFVITWLVIITSRISGFLYIATRAFRDIFNKKEDDKIILFIVSIIAFVVSVLITNNRPVVGILKNFDRYLVYLFIIFILIIPIITCVVYFIRRKSIEQEDSKNK